MSADWIAADWPAPKTVIAGTTLRNGDIASLDLPGEPCWLNQVHGTDVVLAARYDTPPNADACVGRHPGDVCVVRNGRLSSRAVLFRRRHRDCRGTRRLARAGRRRAGGDGGPDGARCRQPDGVVRPGHIAAGVRGRRRSERRFCRAGSTGGRLFRSQ